MTEMMLQYLIQRYWKCLLGAAS